LLIPGGPPRLPEPHRVPAAGVQCLLRDDGSSSIQTFLRPASLLSNRSSSSCGAAARVPCGAAPNSAGPPHALSSSAVSAATSADFCRRATRDRAAVAWGPAAGIDSGGRRQRRREARASGARVARNERQRRSRFLCARRNLLPRACESSASPCPLCLLRLNEIRKRQHIERVPSGSSTVVRRDQFERIDSSHARHHVHTQAFRFGS